MSPPLRPPTAEQVVDGLATSALSETLLPVALAVITLGMGLSLTGEDFRRVAREPRAVAVGALGQVLLLPAIAVGLAYVLHEWYGLSAALAMGLLLLACCPGGATSNLVAHLARADTALSVTLTGVMSLASVVTTPLLFLATTRLVLGEGARVSVSLVETALLILLVVALPIAAGMAVRKRWPGVAESAERPFRVASVAFLALVIAGVVLQNRDGFFDLARASVPAALLLNAAAMGGGLLLARSTALRERQARAVGIEVGFQNGTLGIAIALTQLGSPEAALVPGFYSLVMFATGGALSHAWSRTPAPESSEGDEPAGEPTAPPS